MRKIQESWVDSSNTAIEMHKSQHIVIIRAIKSILTISTYKRILWNKRSRAWTLWMLKVTRNLEISYSKGFTRIKKIGSRRNRCWLWIISWNKMNRTIRIWEQKLELRLCLMSLDKSYKKIRSSLTLLIIKKLKRL